MKLPRVTCRNRNIPCPLHWPAPAGPNPRQQHARFFFVRITLRQLRSKQARLAFRGTPGAPPLHAMSRSAPASKCLLALIGNSGQPPLESFALCRGNDSNGPCHQSTRFHSGSTRQGCYYQTGGGTSHNIRPMSRRYFKITQKYSDFHRGSNVLYYGRNPASPFLQSSRHDQRVRTGSVSREVRNVL